MAPVSAAVIVLFLLTAAAAIWLFAKAAAYNKTVIAVALLLAAVHSAAGLAGFYRNTAAMPPRLAFLLLPSVLLIAALFSVKKGRRFIDGLSLRQLTLLHTVRVPAELCLYALYTAKLVPLSMTFGGYNFDIVSGITAPLVLLAVPVHKKSGCTILLAWNLLCLVLLCIVVVTAIFSAPSPFQRWAFAQPNTGIAYFPFVLLPAVVVPLVLLAHLAAVRRLLQQQNCEAFRAV